jgi:TolB-like protein
VRADLVAALDQLDELVDDLARLRDVLVVAFERQLVAAQPDRAVQAVAQRLEDSVAHAGQLGRNRVRDVQDLVHRRSV